ncbi:VOC family protein [Nocardia sp. NPDC127526]|uniref:VOC family protein n=1 Tax=Nocardia sp. NPDC127526 TaxID=3345393 RepID=UPI003640CABB
MTAPAYNTVAWFQVGSNEPDRVKDFYGALFGWNFASDPNGGGTYDLVSYPGSEIPHGGVAHTPDPAGNHAIFYVLVQDVAATVAAAEQHGGKISTPPFTSPDGLVFAKILDTSGNCFGVFSPAPK